MPLYCWRSTLLRQYTKGYIFVIADNVEQARDKARARFLDLFLDWHDWYDEDQTERARGELEQDLAANPVIADVFYIDGSE